MAIDMATLQEEKVLLQKDFEEMKKNIQKVEVDLIQMKANMNAINGAIQQTDRLLNKLKNEGDEKSKALKEEYRLKKDKKKREKIKLEFNLKNENFNSFTL